MGESLELLAKREYEGTGVEEQRGRKSLQGSHRKALREPVSCRGFPAGDPTLETETGGSIQWSLVDDKNSCLPPAF